MEIVTGQKGYPEDENVVENWMNRLEGSDQRDTQLDQVRVCTKIGIECMDLDPKKRPSAAHIIDRLDKTANTVETGISSSSVEQQVSFLKDHYCQGTIAKLSPEYPEKDIKERAETEELGEYVGTPRKDHWQQGQEDALGDQWSSWEAQYTKQNVNVQGASISSSNSGLLHKLKNLGIFNRKADRNYIRHGGRILEKVPHLKLFQKEEIKPFLKDKYLLRKDGFGEVYKGWIDDYLVEVRKVSKEACDYFTDEVVIHSQVRHKNILRLIGCCLETDSPMLVYEYVSTRSLDDILHSDNKVPLNLGQRLSIAAASAAGLAYVDSEGHTEKLGGLRPEYILLNDNFEPKITNFIPAHDHTVCIGDMDYRDPFDQRTGQLTHGSYLYSFGVIILELIIRKKTRYAYYNSLVDSFLLNHKEGRKSTELFDKEIALTGDLVFLDNLAEIAVECLNPDRDRRPTTMDVAKRLSILHQSHKLAHVQAS